MESHGPRAPLERRLAAALGIAATAALVEVVGSWWSGSLALLSDAGHVGTDAVAVGLSLAAIRIAVRPHTPKMSFGYHRIEVLAAFVNAVLLAAIASSLLVAIYGRIGLEGTPAGLQPQGVAHEIRSVPGVRGVHDLHVWTVTSGLVVLTGHLSVEGTVRVQEAAKIVDAVHARLRERFGIGHVTLQVDSLEAEIIAPAEVSRANPP